VSGEHEQREQAPDHRRATELREEAVRLHEKHAAREHERETSSLRQAASRALAGRGNEPRKSANEPAKRRAKGPKRTRNPLWPGVSAHPGRFCPSEWERVTGLESEKPQELVGAPTSKVRG